MEITEWRRECWVAGPKLSCAQHLSYKGAHVGECPTNLEAFSAMNPLKRSAGDLKSS